MKNTLRRVRMLSQIACSVLFVSLFVFVDSHPRAYDFPAQLMLWLNPLTGLVTCLANRSFVVPVALVGLSVLVLTLVFGRFFCGMVCPIGALIDFSDRYLLRKSRTRSRHPAPFWHRMKYMILIVILVLAAFGVVFPLIMDPLSIATRILSLILFPFLRIVQSESISLMRAVGIERAFYMTVKIPLFYATGLTVLLLGVIIGGGFFAPRFWCQYICPTGAFLGLFSRVALFRRHTDTSKCNACKACAKVCPTGAIDSTTGATTNLSECLVCGMCTGFKNRCSTFSFGLPSREHSGGADIQRRHVLGGVFGGLALLPVFRANALSRRDTHGRLIRPPGSIPEENFAATCIACGECMKACPSNAIQPCSLTDGFHRVFTPRMVPRVGACEKSCNACGYVCPTGAIRKLPLDEKQFVKIGTAVIDRHRCLAWEQNKECLVCDEVCPYNAIEPMVVETTKGTFRVPVVTESLCLGCGFCEQHCPINDQAAIVVYRFGEHRLASGNYLTGPEKEAVLEKRRKSDSHLSRNLQGFEQATPALSGADANGMSGTNQEVPPGFSDGGGEPALPPGFTNGSDNLPPGFSP